MYIGKILKFVVFLFMPYFLSGCSVYESVYGYNKSQVITLNQSVEIPDIFLCSESSAVALHKGNSWWSDKVTLKNLELGLIETGNFSGSNIAGIRFRVTYQKNENNLILDLKANGPYFIDLGVNEALKKLETEILGCLST